MPPEKAATIQYTTVVRNKELKSNRRKEPLPLK
jgi:hypothetical protein